MLSVSHQFPIYTPPKRSVSFASEVDVKEELRAVRDDKKEVTRLLLQSDEEEIDPNHPKKPIL